MKLLRNPLLIKELREEMRSRKIFFLVPIYIAVLSTIAMVSVAGNSGLSFNPSQLAGTSRVTMYAFVLAISILLGLISIVFGASSFTTEREKATYELLELTPLSYTELVLGKFLYALILVGLILLSSLPVLSTLFFMGGLSYLDFALTFFYLILFLAVTILTGIAISIVSSRTIVSIILGLGLAFAISILVGSLTTAVLRDPSDLGFAAISPWLVTWRQIFAPLSLKLAGMDVPLWPVYLLLYGLIILLMISTARNALDSRKLERNVYSRVLALLFVNAYVAVGISCMNSYRPVTMKDADNLYQIVFGILMVTLPMFTAGVMTEKDRAFFESRPILEMVHPKKVLLNYPATGMAFVIILIFSIAVTIAGCTPLTFTQVVEFPATLLIWIFPWMLVFGGMRLLRMRPRSMFSGYVFGMLLHALLAVFYYSGRSVASSYEFFLDASLIAVVTLIALLWFAGAYMHRRRRSGVASAGAVA